MYTVVGSVKTRAVRVIWLLEELGQPYDHIAAAPRSPEALAHNPTGKVPALIVDGTVLTDSVAIMTYLADKHGQFTHPAGTLDRARQDSFTHFLLDEFESLLWTATRHSFVLPEDRRLPAIKPVLHWEYVRSEQTLLTRLGDKPFLMGAEMTVPDLLLAHCLTWAIAAKFPNMAPRLQDYLAQMQARPAYQRAMAR